MLLEKSKELVKEADRTAEYIQSLDKPVRLVAHYDCDGISSAVIAHQGLERAGIDFEISFVEELDAEKLEELRREAFEPVWMFVDIGSGQVPAINEVMDSETVIISDHHEPGDGDVDFHVNPHDVGIDGGEEISGAGVTYLLMRMVDEGNTDLLKYALVGATGDIQKEDGKYLGLNESMMEDAEERGLIERKKGLKLYGRTGKSIVEALKYTTDPYLPGITNSESGAVQFLSELGIDLRENGGWRSLEDLDLEEEKEIVHGLIMRGYDVEELLGDIYVLDNGWEIREFSSLLNAAGRLGRPEDGIRICLENDEELASEVKRDYGREIGKYLSFVEDSLGDSEVVRKFEGGAAIVTGDRVDPNMIGTITTISQKSDIIPEDVLVGLAWKGEDKTKISVRASEEAREKGFRANEVVDEVATACGGEGGGHEAAAGGKIPRENEEKFMEMLSEVVESSI